jgi:hypothetical protein
MGIVIDLVMVGVKKLVEVIPLWMNASAEQRIEIEAKARSLVSGLDALFVAADAKDDAATKKAKDALK